MLKAFGGPDFSEKVGIEHTIRDYSMCNSENYVITFSGYTGTTGNAKSDMKEVKTKILLNITSHIITLYRMYSFGISLKKTLSVV